MNKNTGAINRPKLRPRYNASAIQNRPAGKTAPKAATKTAAGQLSPPELRLLVAAMVD